MQAKPNIILISADSLRANHLGCYGYSLPTSPNIDALACQGTLFEKVFAPGIPTQPSHTTIFTGQHPVTHGVVAHGGKAKLARGTPFLPEILSSEGYTTCAVDTLFRERIWFGRGWEYIIDPSLHHLFYASVTQEELNDRAIHWMQTVPKNPFFMFIHYWDVHYPYTPPDRMRGLFYKGGNPTDPNNHELDEWWGHPVGAMARDTWLRTSNGLITDPKTWKEHKAEFEQGARAAGKKLLVLGDMGEVGDQGVAFHREVGAYARAAGIDRLLGVGDLAQHAVAAFGAGGEHFASVGVLADALNAGPGVTVLVKGSRFMRMERIVFALTSTAAEAH